MKTFKTSHSITILIILVFCLAYLCPNIQAQQEKPFNHLHLKATAKFAEKSNDYYAAIAALEQLNTISKQDASRLYKLAELYKNTRQYSIASDYYNQSYKINKKNSNALYYQALTIKMCDKYSEAIDLFNQYTKISKDQKMVKQAETEIAGCRLAMSSTPARKQQIVIDTMQNLNTSSSESAPVFINDSTILYASILKTENNFKQFITAHKKNKTWHIESNKLIYIKAFEQHENNGAISSDGKRFYYTLTSSNLNNKPVTEIYVTYKTGSNWSQAQKLDENINTPGYNATQPSIAKGKNNNEVIYFISNKPGGKGGLDIWYSIFDIKKGIYSVARNASKLNTTSDETTPYYDNTTKTLYFSSNGWAGFGGFDIFQTTGEENKWTTVKNLGVPFNTNADDLYFTLNSKSNEGFIVSNRSFTGDNQPQCCDDLIYFKIEKNNKITIKGSVAQQNETNKLTSIPIAIYLTTDNNEKIFIDTIYTNNQGEFTFEADDDMRYKLIAGNDEYIRQEIVINTNENTDEEKDELTCQINLTKISNTPLTLDNVYYAFNESEITDESKLMLDQKVIPMLLLNSNVKMEISAYTDQIGSENYNIDLSKKRAESVVNYLIRKGIQAERLYAMGYGESNPIASITNNEQEQSKNRRTEFRVISSSSQLASVMP